MAGHSQFKNIMHRKGAQDAKRAKLFTKLIRELTVAAKLGGPDPEANPRLRAALVTARSSNLPKDTIDRAIKRGAGGEETADYQEIRYEGYGPHGSAFIVETLTDNRNRTAPEIRSCFNKYGGSLGESNSVSFMFTHMGLIHYPPTLSGDALLETALEHGGEDFQTSDQGHEVTCPLHAFGGLRDALIQRFGDPLEARLMWRAQTPLPLEGDALEAACKLIDVLEDNDDVQNVWTNIVLEDA